MKMEVFFYGLFMDLTILEKSGIVPANPRKGYLKDYALKIGARASLVPQRNGKSHGIVMTIDDAALHQLYAESSVADYVPEEVSVVTETNAYVTAVCYNLPPESLTGTNASYAMALYQLAERLGFPGDYLQKIKAMATSGAE